MGSQQFDSQQFQSGDTGVVHTWRGTHNSSNPETQELSTLGGALTTVRLTTVPIRRHRSCPHLEGHSQQFQSGDTGVVHTWRGTHNSSTHNSSNPETQELSTLGG